MLKKVAVSKSEINRLIKQKKYDEAKELIKHVRDILSIMGQKRINKLIENNVILEKERKAFCLVVENELNNKILKEEGYILVDESYVDKTREKIERFKELRERKKITN